jgi:23S rRNA (cytosine1962-C5)-methyltransferase
MDLITKTQKGYSLIDSGDGQKLERFGVFLIVRPEAQALWSKKDPDKWLQANAIFKKDWSILKDTPSEINLEIAGVKTKIQIGKGRNIGVFPEYISMLNIFSGLIKKIVQENKSVKILNLFAHTGLSSVAYAHAGGEVTHVDASRTVNEIAKNQAKENGVENKIRFITEDGLSFIKKEVRREQKYDLIVLDPPAFGRGDKGQVFKIEEKIQTLIEESKKLLSENPIGILLSGYSSEFVSASYSNILNVHTNMETLHGTLAIEEEGGRLSLAIGKWAFACASTEIKDIISGLISN